MLRPHMVIVEGEEVVEPPTEGVALAVGPEVISEIRERNLRN